MATTNGLKPSFSEQLGNLPVPHIVGGINEGHGCLEHQDYYLGDQCKQSLNLWNGCQGAYEQSAQE